MTQKPHVANYIDVEERELIEAIEAYDYMPGESLMTPELVAQMQEAARNTLNAAKKSRSASREEISRA